MTTKAGVKVAVNRKLADSACLRFTYYLKRFFLPNQKMSSLYVLRFCCKLFCHSKNVFEQKNIGRKFSIQGVFLVYIRTV